MNATATVESWPLAWDYGKWESTDESSAVRVNRHRSAPASCPPRLACYGCAPDGRFGSIRLLNRVRGGGGEKFADSDENQRQHNDDLDQGDDQTGDRQSTTAFVAVFDLMQRDQPKGNAQENPPQDAEDEGCDGQAIDRARWRRSRAGRGPVGAVHIGTSLSSWAIVEARIAGEKRIGGRALRNLVEFLDRFGIADGGRERLSFRFRYFVTLAVAWSLAGLAGRVSPGLEEVGVALSFRALGEQR
jgi:hypothetical protein